MNPIVVAGVATVGFYRPSEKKSYLELGSRAVRAALTDAGVTPKQIVQVFAGHVYGDSTCGQACAYAAGIFGAPIVNTNNNCATGSTALALARQAIESGSAQCVLAFGFEEMRKGALGTAFPDRVSPLMRHGEIMIKSQGFDANVSVMAQMFGGAGRELAEAQGLDDEVFGLVAVKARKHAAANPTAVFRDIVTIEDVMSSPAQYGPLTRLQCCPPTSGAAAAVLCTPGFAKANGLRSDVVMVAQTMLSDAESSFAGDMRGLVGEHLSRATAHATYEAASIGPEDVDVVELHDCFTVNELLSMIALGLVDEDGIEAFVRDGRGTFGTGVVINPSGGLLSKGHPLGATGVAQCAELVWQLRGEADERQVEGARIALQHNIGLGGAAVVSLYQRLAN